MLYHLEDMLKRDVLLPEELGLRRTLHDDRGEFEKTNVPIVTISATFRTALAKKYGLGLDLEEAVFSRAHFSMAVGVFLQAKKMGFSSWLVDPTNYVSGKDWKKVVFTEWVGERAARSRFLKKIKDLVDTFVRSKLPIANTITSPLKYVTEDTKRTVISMHYESGNILAREGKRVLQVVTDPHVRVNYLLEAERENITFAVFDEETKAEFFKKALEQGKRLEAGKVVVTGPPIDPRIVEGRSKRGLVLRRPLRLVVATGGLGTNKGEIEAVVKELLDELVSGKVQVVLYAGTHPDVAGVFDEVCKECKLVYGELRDEDAPIRVIYSPNIIEVNNDLIEFGFGWADGFVTKPSGDMAYDAAAAGCFILSLTSWGEWEENVEKIFTNLGICQKADVGNFSSQIKHIVSSGWVEGACDKAFHIDKLFLEGAKKIVDLQQGL